MTELDDSTSDGIVVRLVGGLGNQLFIYAAGRAVAERLGCPLLIDISAFGKAGRGGTERRFELNWLTPEDSIIRGHDLSLPTQVMFRLSKLTSRRSGRRRFHEAGFHYDPRISDVKRGTLLTGYFQSWRYFTSIEQDLRAEILQKAPVSEWSYATRESLKCVEPWVGIHVRRGDYVQARNRAHHGLLSTDYYKNALVRLVADRSLPLVVFSDDPEGARALISPIATIDHLIVPPSNVDPIESLVTMSQASSLAIANSSFGWWGAWLGGTRCAPIIAPDPWFAHNHTRQADLYLPAWQTLPSTFS